MRLARAVFFWAMAVLSGIVGMIILLVGFYGMACPVGAKMADDSDPFGPPPGPLSSIIVMLLGALFMVWRFCRADISIEVQKKNIIPHP
jgi:hypothetical protein